MSKKVKKIVECKICGLNWYWDEKTKVCDLCKHANQNQKKQATLEDFL